MPPLKLAAILNQIKLILAQELKDNLLLVTLYGSYAREEATEGSDVDLLVVLKRLTPKDERLIENIIYDVMWKTDFTYFFSLNLVDEAHYRTWKRQNASLLRNILREGQVLWTTN